ncbi:MAG: glucokinase [Ginsengibacter sp.]
MLPFFLNQSKWKDSTTVLAADVGATKTNVGLFRVEQNQLVTLREGTYPSQQFKSANEIFDLFLKEISLPQILSLAVAGPVINNKANITNLLWEIERDEIASHVGVPDLYLINDLEATAFGLAMLTEKDTVMIHKGSENPIGNAAVIAPGTGLGEAGLFWDEKFYHPFATEGGHSDFASRNSFDFALYEYLQNKFGHVSWETVVSGPGISNIYKFLRDEKKREEPEWLSNKIQQGELPAVISRSVERSELCRETMQLFIRFLAFESANLVVKLKATGGLFIGGGIAPQNIRLFEQFKFNDSFCSSGRLNFLLEKVPVKVILNPKTALLGAAFYGAKNFRTK